MSEHSSGARGPSWAFVFVQQGAWSLSCTEPGALWWLLAARAGLTVLRQGLQHQSIAKGVPVLPLVGKEMQRVLHLVLG